MCVSFVLFTCIAAISGMYALHCGRYYIYPAFPRCYIFSFYLSFISLFFIFFLTSGSAEWNCVLICGLWSCGLISLFVRVRAYGCLYVC